MPPRRTCRSFPRATGRPEQVLHEAGRRGPHVDVNALKLWIRASTDPAGSRSQLVPYLRTIADAPLKRPSLWGAAAAAFLLDETDLAVRLLQEALQRLRAPGVRARRALGVAALADGSYLQAFTQLRGLFSEDSTPLHTYASYLGVADLAAAAPTTSRALSSTYYARA
jgi:hypothetical protein